jgi:hypothetical protein
MDELSSRAVDFVAERILTLGRMDIERLAQSAAPRCRLPSCCENKENN